MPTVTNVHNLPEALVRAVVNDPYTGGGDISVTKLIDAPQVRVLAKQHHDQIVVDVSERIWALLGQGVHTVLERAALRAEGMAAETRLYAEIAGWTLSGQFDVMALESGMLSDYKVTTVYKLQNIDKWTQQLNILRWLAYKNGEEVKGLEIIAILRDWKKGEAERKSEYPQQPIVRVPIPMWDLDETEEFIVDRITLHRYAEQGGRVSCDDDDRWYTGSQWALMKEGGKRAVKLQDTPFAVVPEGHYVQERPGEYRRCQSYCEVRDFCAQWAATKEAA
jgi:hypothetical protein